MLYKESIKMILEREKRSLETTKQIVVNTNNYITGMVQICESSDNSFQCYKLSNYVYSQGKRALNLFLAGAFSFILNNYILIFNKTYSKTYIDICSHNSGEYMCLKSPNCIFLIIHKLNTSKNLEIPWFITNLLIRRSRPERHRLERHLRSGKSAQCADSKIRNGDFWSSKRVGKRGVNFDPTRKGAEGVSANSEYHGQGRACRLFGIASFILG